MPLATAARLDRRLPARPPAPVCASAAVRKPMTRHDPTRTLACMLRQGPMAVLETRIQASFGENPGERGGWVEILYPPSEVRTEFAIPV